jgi:2-keto-4-pentenoate hydratase/2-oxohepta-3-ene-1,7-dioic acid hydratase in catechol pathway
MRLCSYSRPPGGPRLGLQLGGAVLDLERYSHLHPGRRLPPDMLSFIEAGPGAWEHARELGSRFEKELASHDLAQDAEAGLAYDAGQVRLHAPIPRPRKNIVCLGRNYAAHARELSHEQAAYPIFFTKPPTAVIGPEDRIPYPHGLTDRFDWEVELGVVI